MIIELSKPYDFEGKTYEKIEILTDGMTGQDLIELQRKYKKISSKKEMLTASSLSLLTSNTDFNLFVLSELSGQPIEFFTGLPCADMMSAIAEIQAFLLG